MSDIRANTISDTSGNGPINLHKQSATKAWAKYNASSVISGSFGISSTVDEQPAGETTVNLTNAMIYDSNNYVVSGACNGTTGDRLVTIASQSALKFKSYTWDGATRSSQPVGVAVHGDLA